MSAAKLPLPYRDSCAHLLIPLNRCRVDEYYLPWKCEVGLHITHWSPGGWVLIGVQNERHSYEKCQYEEFKQRVAKMEELRSAKGGARSN